MYTVPETERPASKTRCASSAIASTQCQSLRVDCVVQSGDAATFLLISAGKRGELFSEVGEGSSAGFFPPYCANVLLCTLYFFFVEEKTFSFALLCDSVCWYV